MLNELRRKSYYLTSTLFGRDTVSAVAALIRKASEDWNESAFSLKNSKVQADD